MPVSAPEDREVPGQHLAILAEALYLLNLLLLPGLAFLLLLLVWLWHGSAAPVLARNHLQQAFSASIWAGALLFLMVTTLFAASVGGWPYILMLTLIFLLCCHAALVLMGVMGLAKAMNGLPFRYWLIGPQAEVDGTA